MMRQLPFHIAPPRKRIRSDDVADVVDLTRDEGHSRPGSVSTDLSKVKPVQSSKSVSISSILMPKRTKKEVKESVNPIQVEDDVVEVVAPSVKPAKLLAGGKFLFGSPRLKSEVCKVSLKVDPVKLDLVLKGKLKPLDMKPTPIEAWTPAKSANTGGSFFKEVQDRMKSAHEHPRPKYVKHMDLPPLHHDDFLVEDIEQRHELTSAEVSLPLIRRDQLIRRFMAVNYSFDVSDCMKLFSEYKRSEPASTLPSYTSMLVESFNRDYDLEDSRFSRFDEMDSKYRLDKSSQWVDLFKPRTHGEIMQIKAIRNGIRRWLIDSFKSLKKVDRSKRKDQLRKRRKKAEGEMNDFIVDDLEDEEDDPDAYVPSLILAGPRGCGKTSSVYAIVKNEMNGIVFELNSGQARAKKDISFHLKQIGTTKIVNKDDGKGRDRTVILFDDVDLIDDEEMDREFWQCARELLSYTYRPVIFTTEDLGLIPRHIVDRSTVFCLDNVAQRPLKEYLDLVALERGMDLSPKIIKGLAQTDLRQALMQLQMFSYRFHIPDEGLVRVGLGKEPPAQDRSLQELSFDYDMEYCFQKDQTDEIDDVSISQKNNSMEFLASQYIRNGSRRTYVPYQDGYDYLDSNLGCLFHRLGRSTLATDVVSIIHEMAKAEQRRRIAGGEAKFQADPEDLFDTV